MPVIIDPDRFNRAVISVLAAVVSCRDEYGTEIRAEHPFWSVEGVKVVTNSVKDAIASIIGLDPNDTVTVRFPGADT